jgi:hypothetical protein
VLAVRARNCLVLGACARPVPSGGVPGDDDCVSVSAAKQRTKASVSSVARFAVRRRSTCYVPGTRLCAQVASARRTPVSMGSIAREICDTSRSYICPR